MVTNYFWNIALCRELYTCLGILEVAMRNSIHDTLTVHFGTAAWYDWRGLLLDREARNISRVMKDIRDARKEVIPGRIVAGLSFGFWTSMLDSAYGHTLWSQQGAPGTDLLRQAFPFAPPYYSVRRRVHRRVNTVRNLRNRVFHYEPIWHWNDLQLRHAEIIEVIGWINPTARSSTIALDRFPPVFQHGRTTTENDLKRHLRIC